MKKSRDWIKAGGALGILVLITRLTSLPLATILTVLPLLVELLRREEMRAGVSQPPAASNARMSVEEARLILGVHAHASAEDIRQAHRKLMMKNHPDKGGSDYLAAKINQARDVLLETI